MLARTALGPPRLLTLFAVGLVVVVAYLPYQSPSASVTPAHAALAPSAETTGFLAAYGSGDEELADSLASPLYRAEWARRGLGARERMAIRGFDGGSTSRASLRFEPVGGALTNEGFGHYLYVVSPTRQESDDARHYSVWRVDADPLGRVIWLELVWLFGADAEEVIRVDDAAALSRVPMPSAVASGWHPIVGVASPSSGEGYYLIGPSGGLRGATYTPTRTYAVDRSGAIRPGAWTYGAGGETVEPYPPRREAGSQVEVESRDLPLLEGYIRVLG